jgi:NIMA (never in mitosis gene a)-related kinase
MAHPYIIKFKEVYVTRSDKLVLVMEYAQGGDLSKRISEQKSRGRYFEEELILDWFTQICLAIKHVHDRKIIHRDIKGQNIFLTSTNKCKLGDFGIARALTSTLEKVKTVIGTPYYLSPEIIESKPYSFASDIWSLGVLLYEMCMLKPPFVGQSLQFLALKIVQGQYEPLHPSFSMSMRNLVNSMLQLDPNRRPSVNQIVHMPIV